ncbi:HAD superfamily, subfamily IIIB acid phosphatase [Hibiscus syriacus]|uniref:HAD superfamily, subfamily IIIB acid phosphatase n=1 Tax=Hibiscus syriacus TaxID=106335 RepID=A0A6A2WQ21_HIBSY|nr:putative kinase-like protein TMKL1 [Hibiscus syriacus]XP_039046819.1 putative kinase-like protein TMKL1 [Hibiscus syriacus]KAE8661941.1 HAD superfamily, subfamily IIIB acid phosphatase [Hibiscus syriacus]
MKNTHMLKLLLLSSLAFLFILLLVIFFCRKRAARNDQLDDVENNEQQKRDGDGEDEGESEMEDMITFSGGEDLTIGDILDAPGEVIGKSNYGTLYKALLQRSSLVRLLRFFRPVCALRGGEFSEVVQLLGCIRHPNLVPLLGFYAGPRGEKLLVHPFYWHGNLSQLIRDGSVESHSWAVIYKISIGMARGLDHLHTGLQKPIVHGNLKSKNVLLDRNYEPYISDFGIYLLLNPAAGQEILEASAAEGYKAPELIKMRDASKETDVCSLGVIFLELLSGKEPINEKPTPDEDFYLPNFMRNAVLDHRISDLYHPDFLLRDNSDKGNPVTEESILKFFQLALACCSPSPSLRPNIRQVLVKLEEIGK